MPLMLVTRPDTDAARTQARLGALGIDSEALPLLDCVPLASSLPEPKGFAALAVTSANALEALHRRGVLGGFLGLKVFAVGERTAATARELGFADVVATGGTLDHLVAAIAGAELQGPVFYPSARHPSGDLARSLAAFGVLVVTTRVYDMRMIEAVPDGVVKRLNSGRFAAALFYSKRTAEAFVSLLGSRLEARAKSRLGMLCLSEQVASPLIAARFIRIGLADHPNEAAMMALALSFARDQNTA